MRFRNEDYLFLIDASKRDLSSLTPDDGNRSNLRNVMFERPKMMDDAHNNTHVYCNIPSSETFSLAYIKDLEDFVGCKLHFHSMLALSLLRLLNCYCLLFAPVSLMLSCNMLQSEYHLQKK
jgi:hypothetical protein